MKNQGGGNTTDQKPAAERIEEARQLYRNINETLNAVLTQIKDGQLEDVALLPKQMTQLTNIVGDSRKKEAEFNDKFGDGNTDGDIDFDELRHQIGCRLSRIRRCCKSE